MTTRPPPLIALLLAAWCSLVPAGTRAVLIVPLKIQVMILAKVLEYDRNLKDRAKGKVVIGVVTDGKNGSQRDTLLESFEICKSTRVQGLAVEVVSIVFTSADSLGQQIEAASVNALYTTGVAAAQTASAVLELARRKKIPAFGDTEKMVADGFVLSVVLEGERPKMVVNYAEIGRQGMILPSTLLTMTRAPRL